MILVNAFIKKSVNRNGCTAWQWLHWIKLFIAIPSNVRRCNHCWASKRLKSQLARFDTVFETDVCW